MTKIQPAPPTELMTVKSAALYYLIQRGRLPAIQIGSRWRLKKSTLDSHILKYKGEQEPTAMVLLDDANERTYYRNSLKEMGIARVISISRIEALHYSMKQRFDVALLNFPNWNNDVNEFLDKFRLLQPDALIVLVTQEWELAPMHRLVHAGPITIFKAPLDQRKFGELLRQMGKLGNSLTV